VEDIPQPSSEPYSTGDRVEIYVGPDDEDARFHGTVCEVVEVHEDDLDAETGRATDAYSYSLMDVNSDEVLPISFRHHDLVPTDDG
jgi:hypothetical protein